MRRGSSSFPTLSILRLWPLRRPDSLLELRQQFGVASDTPVVLGVFRLNEEKRPLLFVETFAAVVARVPKARAFVAGVGPFEEAMRQRIDELNLQASLTLLGRRDDVPAADADFFPVAVDL